MGMVSLFIRARCVACIGFFFRVASTQIIDFLSHCALLDHSCELFERATDSRVYLAQKHSAIFGVIRVELNDVRASVRTTSWACSLWSYSEACRCFVEKYYGRLLSQIFICCMHFQKTNLQDKCELVWSTSRHPSQRNNRVISKTSTWAWTIPILSYKNHLHSSESIPVSVILITIRVSGLRSCNGKDLCTFCVCKCHQTDGHEHIEYRDNPKSCRHWVNKVQHHNRCYWDQRRQDARDPICYSIDGSIFVPNNAMFTRRLYAPPHTCKF